MVSSDILSSPSLSTVLPSEGASVHGFKEWSLVCEALGTGVQSLILRKGGIHEGRGGFWWRHNRFFLFPTHFHEQGAQFPWSRPEKSGMTAPAVETDAVTHTLEFLAVVDFKHQITSWEAAAALEPFHFWTEETVRARFDYSEEAGISLAFLRVYRLAEPWTFPDQRNFGGCRSWLDLPKPPESLSVIPVLDEA
ncbi:MAG: DUF1802 family protein, partial [Verrucomicrobiaceae bacterium]